MKVAHSVPLHGAQVLVGPLQEVLADPTLGVVGGPPSISDTSLFSPTSRDKGLFTLEHVSQLSQPDCKFCLHPSSDPKHSDCSRLNVHSGGNN